MASVHCLISYVNLVMLASQLSGIVYRPGFQQWLSPVGLLEG